MSNALQRRQQAATQKLGGRLREGDASGFMGLIRQTVSDQLPRHLAQNKDTYLRTVVTLLRKNPKLMECNPASLVGAVVEAAQVGLRPGVLGECHFVPFKGEVTLIYGFQGYIALAARAGVHIKPPIAVYPWEEFSYQPADMAHPLSHIVDIDEEPGDENEAWAKLRATYAIADTGSKYPAVMVVSKKKLAAVGDSKRNAKRTNTWKTHPLQMALKTAVIRLAKYCVKSPELSRAMENDGHSIRAESGELAVYVDSEAIDPMTGEVSEMTAAEKAEIERDEREAVQ